jgi:hypothetical protein
MGSVGILMIWPGWRIISLVCSCEEDVMELVGRLLPDSTLLDVHDTQEGPPRQVAVQSYMETQAPLKELED